MASLDRATVKRFTKDKINWIKIDRHKLNEEQQCNAHDSVKILTRHNKTIELPLIESVIGFFRCPRIQILEFVLDHGNASLETIYQSALQLFDIPEMHTRRNKNR